MINITSRLWLLSIVGTALILSIPILTIAFSVLEPPSQNWQHLKDTVLFEYLGNSLLLTCGVGSGTLLIGVSTAWLTAMCRFPGKKLFVWLLLLPMAMPAYIVAYTYTGMFDFAGPVQTAIRDLTGWGYRDYYFPQIRSMSGAIAMLSFVLYPYIYLLARSTFLEQSVGVMEVARTLDCGPWTVFYRVALPLARPAIVAGLSLALMETLADYGTVAYFGLSVFTTGIFRVWFGLGDYTAAAKMAALLLLFVFALIILERISRNKAQYHNSSGKLTRFTEYQLHGFKAWGSFATCAFPVFLGFLLPAGSHRLGGFSLQVAPRLGAGLTLFGFPRAGACVGRAQPRCAGGCTVVRAPSVGLRSLGRSSWAWSALWLPGWDFPPEVYLAIGHFALPLSF